MAITATNGTVVSATEINWNCKKYGGMYLFLNYTKGTETSVTVYFTVTDDTMPTGSGAFYITQITDLEGTLAKWSVTLSSTDDVVIPVPLPECADTVSAVFSFNTPGATPGDLVVWANMADIYR